MAYSLESLVENGDIEVVEDEPFTDLQSDSMLDLSKQEYHEAMAEASRNDESIIEWFDKTVNDELAKHRLNTEPRGRRLSLSPGMHDPRVVESAGSTGIDVASELRTEPHTDLLTAVDKLARAEAMCEFEGAVRAAEKAAASAPPELAEEAAAAGARGYQAELTSVVQQRLPGERPIEVIGYVGITKPTRAACPRTCQKKSVG